MAKSTGQGIVRGLAAFATWSSQNAICGAASRGWAIVGSVFCSAERKARDAASILAQHLGLIPSLIVALGENATSRACQSAGERISPAMAVEMSSFRCVRSSSAVGMATHQSLSGNSPKPMQKTSVCCVPIFGALVVTEFCGFPSGRGEWVFCIGSIRRYRTHWSICGRQAGRQAQPIRVRGPC